VKTEVSTAENRTKKRLVTSMKQQDPIMPKAVFPLYFPHMWGEWKSGGIESETKPKINPSLN
jgi:hypothetical protein